MYSFKLLKAKEPCQEAEKYHADIKARKLFRTRHINKNC